VGAAGCGVESGAGGSDDPAVLSSHVPGVKKRLKGDDLAAFERWIAKAPGTR
jgi:hypothetical protein